MMFSQKARGVKKIKSVFSVSRESNMVLRITDFLAALEIKHILHKSVTLEFGRSLMLIFLYPMKEW